LEKEKVKRQKEKTTAEAIAVDNISNRHSI